MVGGNAAAPGRQEVEKTVSPSCWTRAVRPLEATPCSLENMQGLQQRVAPWFHTCWTGWGTGLTSSNLEAPQKTRVLACSLERKGDIAMSAVDENHVRGATNICRRAPAFGSPPPTPFTTAFVGVHALGGGGAVRPLEATPCSLENMQGLQQRVAPWFHTCWTGWGTGLTSSNLEAPQKTRVLACSLERKGDIYIYI